MRWFLIVPMVALFLIPSGCGPKKKDSTPPTKTIETDKPVKVEKKEPTKSDTKAEAKEPFKKPASGTISRRFEAGELQNLLRQLSIAHAAFVAERNRSPASVEELESYYEKSPKINQLLKEGDIVMIWKSTRPEDPSNTVLAYEAQVDRMGLRVVLKYDGSPELIPDADFQKMPKAASRK